MGHVEWTYGNLRALEGAHQEAAAHFEKALSVFEVAGQRRVLADLCQAYSRMLAESGGDGERAGQLMERAEKIYTELGLEDRAARCR
jgi:hypothetical protein